MSPLVVSPVRKGMTGGALDVCMGDKVGILQAIDAQSVAVIAWDSGCTFGALVAGPLLFGPPSLGNDVTHRLF